MDKKGKILIILIFVLFTGLRIIHLDADPPVNLSGSAGYFVDEGGWVFNARNKVLFGSWEIDRYNKMYLAPLINLAYFLSFSAFGPGYISARLVSIFFSILIFLFFYLTIRDSFNKKTALISTFLLSINYLFIVFNRITHPRMGMIFFMVLSLYLFHKATRYKDYYFIPLGSTIFLGFICQATVIYFVPAVIVSTIVICLRKGWRRGVIKLAKAAIYLFIGSIIIFLPWYIWNYRPHIEDINLFSAIIRHRQYPAGPIVALRNLWREPSWRYFLYYMPFIWIGAWIYLFSIITKTSSKKIRDINPVEILCCAWIACGLAFLAIMNNPALRWYISIIPPLVILSGLLISKLTTLNTSIKLNYLTPLSVPLLTFYLFFPIKYLLNSMWEFEFPSGIKSTIYLSLALSFLLFFFLKRINLKYLKYGLVSLCILGLLGSILLNGRFYLKWMRRPRYKIKNLSAELGSNLKKAVIVGLWSAEICLGNQHRAYISWKNLINDDKDFLKRVGATHIFAVKYNREDQYYKNQFPEVMKNAKLLGRYHLWRTDAELYEIQLH